MSRPGSTIKTQLKILMSLSEGPKTFYDLTKREKIASNSTVLNALRELVRIHEVKEEQAGSRGRKPYSLTHEGLILVLYTPKGWEQLDTIAEGQSELLPLIFGKWHFYEENGLKEEISIRLKLAVLQIRDWTRNIRREFSIMGEIVGIDDSEVSKILRERVVQMTNDLGKLWHNKITERTFFPGTIYPWEDENVPNQMDFLTKIHGDPELSAFVTKYFEDTYNDLMSQMNNLETWRTMWRKFND